MPLAPPPQVECQCRGRRSTLAKALPSRTTTPGTPPSRTIRLRAQPSAITGTSPDRAAQEGAAGHPGRPARTASPPAPPVLNQTSGASGGQLAARGRPSAPASGEGRRRARSCRALRPCRDGIGQPAAHLVMSPAPRQTTMSPGCDHARQLPGQRVRPGTVSPLRWPRAFSPATSAAASTPRSAARRPDRPARHRPCRHR
jgi:hypothetical protein